MKLIVVLLVALAPSLAVADKSYVDGHGATWDCAKDATVSILANGGSYTFKGTCKHVSISGNKNKVSIDKVAVLDVSGNENKVTATAAGEIDAAGNHNTVTYTNGLGHDAPTISNLGTGNKIAGGSAHRKAPSKH
jgi:hypothetical protein